MKNVIVTNKGDEPFSGKYDSKPYDFPVGVPVTIPEIAATFLFAYGMSEADRGRVLVRNAWLRSGVPDDPYGPKAAAKRLQSFVFKSAPDDAPRAKPKAIVVPGTERAVEETRKKRELGGISKVNPDATLDTGMQTIRPRETIRLPGSKGPIVPPMPPA